MGNPTVLGALVGWPILMIVLVAFMPARRVVMVSIIGGNLFLPQAQIVLPGFPNYSKPLAAGLGALLAAVIMAAPKLLSWRPARLDLFFFAFLVAPGISSLANGLGSYDAMAVTVNRFLEWGVAYWVGRALLNDDAALRDLAVAFVIGGLVYLPLCVWESVMSPRLHSELYGFRPSSFRMTRRWGGWRPTVFMQHGLAVAAWMGATAVVAWVLWRSKVVASVAMVPIKVVAIGLVVGTIALRSTGAAILVVMLIGAAEVVQTSRSRTILMVLLLAPAGYIGLRVAGWDGDQLVSFAARLGEERAGSLNMRLENDAIIVDKAMERPVFGWGGWGRWRVKDPVTGKDITVSDSWWGILVGSTGVFGLVAAYGTFIAPMFVMIRRKTSSRIFDQAQGAAWAVGLAVLLFVIDTLANAMPNSSFMLASGAMAGFVSRPRRAVAAQTGPPPGVPNGRPPAPPRPRTIDLR